MDIARFDQLYQEHARRLYAFLAYRTGDPEGAEDLLSAVFERALRGRSGFDRLRGTEEAWLYTIALNLVRDRSRRTESARRAQERIDAERVGVGGDHAEAVPVREAVMDAVRGLSADEQEVVALRFGADLTVPQIAKLTKLPLTTVEGRLTRALRKLRAELDA